MYINKNIKAAVNKIIEEIHKPFNNKKIIFFFGAGINHNFLKRSLTWKGLSETVIKNCLKDNTCERVKSNKNNLTKQSTVIFKAINNNLLASSLSKSPIEIKCELKNVSEYAWFVKGFKEIENTMSDYYSKNVIVVTTNYDKTLSKVLYKNSINLLNKKISTTDLNEIIDESVLHLHGMVNDENSIGEDNSILSIQSYINKSKDVQKWLSEKILKQEIKEANEIIIIMGYSMRDLHILKALKDFVNQEGLMKKVFLIGRIHTKNIIIERIKEVYKELGITFLNISPKRLKNESAKEVKKNYYNDFKNFWKLLSKKISDNYKSLKQFFEQSPDKIKKLQKFDINFYAVGQYLNKLFKKSKGEPLKKIQELLRNFINNRKFMRILCNQIKTFLYHEEIDKKFLYKILRENEFKLPLNFLIDFLDGEKILEEDWKNILIHINKEIFLDDNENFSRNYGRNIINLIKAGKNYIKIIKKNSLNNLIVFLFREIISDKHKKHKEQFTEIEEKFLDGFTYSYLKKNSFWKIYKRKISWMRLKNFEVASPYIFMSKLLKKDLENPSSKKNQKAKKEPIEKVFSLYEGCDTKKVINFLKFHFRNYQNISWRDDLLLLFQLKKYIKIMKNSAETIIEEITKKWNNSDVEIQRTYKFFFTMLYYAWLNGGASKKSSVEELKKILKQDKFPIHYFPETWEIFGGHYGGWKNFSKFDGQEIFSKTDKKKITSFKTFKDTIKGVVETNKLSEERVLQIRDFVSNKLTPKIYKYLIENKICGGYNIQIANMQQIQWKCKTWKEYKEFLRIQEKFLKIPEYNLSSKITILPPENLFQRAKKIIQELTFNSSLKKSYKTKLYKELTEIAMCQFYLSYSYNAEKNEYKNISYFSELFFLTKWVVEENDKEKEKTQKDKEKEKTQNDKEKEKTQKDLNEIFKSIFNWEEDHFIKIIKTPIKITSWNELEFLFFYFYKNNEISKFQLNSDKIKELFNDVKNKEETHFYSIIRYCIFKSNDSKQKFKEFKKLARESLSLKMENTPKDKQQNKFRKLERKTNSNDKQWIRRLQEQFTTDAAIWYLTINKKEDIEFDLNISIGNLFFACWVVVKKLQKKIEDVRFKKILEKINPFEINIIQEIIWNYEITEFLGEGSKKKLEEFLIESTKNIDKKNISHKSIIDELIKTLPQIKFLSRETKDKLRRKFKNILK